MTSRLDRLEAAGFVERTLDPNDRRSFRIRLTDKGFEVVDAAMTEHTANVTELLSSLRGKELGLLDDVLRKLLREYDTP